MIGLFLPMALSMAPAAADRLDLSRIASTTTMEGTCRKLILPGGGDNTSRCAGKIAHITYRDGRSSFRIAVAGNILIGFYGNEKAATGDTATLVVTNILVTPPFGRGADVLNAEGECRFTAPGAGPAQVECKATRPGEAYELSFASDGKPPTVERP
ncbi:hypothetical protein FG91_04110 [Sphingopyxis sp. LC81]|uniref:hypothetical protein n=1 Tax=Sphingopyxis sp. LC81 TaxID=1502850 RepID=UPI00050E4EFF|nr:hypothetical protein [Sphingopyxis sp. LC81]KGB51746.1 hypothetical protein FG91_04110 [Sphingopyxis sp. LC81]